MQIKSINICLLYTSDVTSWVGIVVLAGGIYCLYATIMMKTKGEINQNILLGREYQFKKSLRCGSRAVSPIRREKREYYLPHNQCLKAAN